jgi:ribokinase
MSKILVIGSSNTDLITKVKSFPCAGETIEGISFFQAMGGKGANQAIAAKKLGGDVQFITCLGKDSNGQNALKHYKKEGLNISSSLIVEDIPSGVAMIMVDEKGENCIVITPGANNKLSPEHILKMEKEIVNADIVVLQMEIPIETVKTACKVAKKNQKVVLLNVAPARPVDSELLNCIDILVVNEVEAETISGKKLENVGKKAVVDSLLAMGPKNVVLTLGKEGCVFKKGNELQLIPSFSVETLDSTAAGDTFCGALAAELSRGNSWGDAIKFATAASAICVTRMGAQPSIPTEKEVREFLNKNIEMATSD